MWKNLLNDESGATAIEYGLIAALLITALIVSLQLLGASVSDLYEWTSTVVEAIN